MKFDFFKSWLENQGTLGKRPIGDCLSRNKRIECDLKINLDFEYERDRGAKLIDLLTYTIEDKNKNVPSPIPIDGDLITGLASLKAAAKKYFDFCNSIDWN